MKTKRPRQKYSLVEVWWDDATSLAHGWKSNEEFKKEALLPEMVLSVGFLIAEANDHIVLAMDVDKDGQHNQRSQVPRSMVKHLRVIRKADVDKPAATVV